MDREESVKRVDFDFADGRDFVDSEPDLLELEEEEDDDFLDAPEAGRLTFFWPF